MFDWLLMHLVTLQTITLNGTQPCFLNYTAGIDIWQNCGMRSDYIRAALSPWVWVTGGYFSMIIVSIFVVMTWIKYQKVVYPITVGTIGYFPIAYFFFPASFISFAIIGAMVAIGLLIGYIFISQTNES